VKALKAEGYRVILVNSNPATIMTDPGLADATYIEPITPEMVEKIIEVERPDALLPTMGGQTALNCALTLDRTGVLAKYGVEMIGAKADVIEKAEPWTRSGLRVRARACATRWKKRSPRWIMYNFPRSSAHRSPWAGLAGASPTMWKSSRKSSSVA